MFILYSLLSRFVLNDGKMWLCEPQARQVGYRLALLNIEFVSVGVLLVIFVYLETGLAMLSHFA